MVWPKSNPSDFIPEHLSCPVPKSAPGGPLPLSRDSVSTPRQVDCDIYSCGDVFHSKEIDFHRVSCNPYVELLVTDCSFSSDGVVMYHIDVRGPHGPLSTYTIRRRYTDFKTLHDELCKIMVDSTLLTKKQKKLLFSSYPSLPPMPHGGVWSYMRRHDKNLLERRRLRFQEILDAASRHPIARESVEFQSFLSFAPSAIINRGSSYVSLRDYSVPRFEAGRESIERKKVAMRRRKSQTGRRSLPELSLSQDRSSWV
jgi:hypothetical protein